ncbi:MAG: glycoside hydrolase family 130 protein [Kiritimatiellales bacterium]|nr:glycoside hydrolase family 130 protein [Kiritimatiellales bacterium]
MSKIVGGVSLAKIPWQERPADSSAILWRYDANPIIGWNPIPDGARAFNSAVVPFGGGFVGVFRIDHHNDMPQLHFGTSENAIDWNIQNDAIRFVSESGEPMPRSAYYYDPRVVKIEDTYYVTWCNEFIGTMSPTIGIAKTTDFKSFVQLENAFLPFNRNGVLFPRKIGGEFVMLNRPSDNGHTPFGDVYLSRSPDMTFWGKHRLVMKAGQGGWWEATKIGPGPVPIETDEGWLVIYHAVINNCNGFVYSFGSVILDLDDPSKVLARSSRYLLSPEKPYETTGFVPNVAFPCATLCDADTGRLAVYYGAADTYTALAFGNVYEIMEWTRANSSI